VSIFFCRARRNARVDPDRGGLRHLAYLFTASTSFANPAVTLARSVTNTFTGTRPADAAGFIAAQLAGAFTATSLFRWLMHTLNGDQGAVLADREHANN
jgi:glycerol uptake facilitator-like aquaporin